MSKTFSVADVASHKDAGSGMYIIVDENVYDVTGISPSSLPLLYSHVPFPILFQLLQPVYVPIPTSFATQDIADIIPQAS